jgi:hypothetical protein
MQAGALGRPLAPGLVAVEGERHHFLFPEIVGIGVRLGELLEAHFDVEAL